MKKIFTGVMILVLSLILISCTPKESLFTAEASGFYTVEFTAMNASDNKFKIHKDDPKFEEKEVIAKEILDLFNKYHELTDNFNSYKNLKNVYYINKHPNEKIKIDKVLFDLISYSEELKINTNGYFDISIGLIIDEWKKLLSKEELLETVTKEDFNETLDIVNKIPVIKDGIKLESNKNEYFITILDGVKIDLGAIAKGTAINEAKKIVVSHGVKYYQLFGSASSVYYGENANKDRDHFNVGLSGPLDYINDNLSYGNNYEIVSVKNTSVTTSGDAIQQATVDLGNDDKYLLHHIISPISKKPENFRRMLTVISEDASRVDGLTTALFSMPTEDLEKWLEDNKDEVVIFLDSNLKSHSFNATEYIYK